MKRLETDVPQLLGFYSFPKQLWRTLRPANVIERCFVEVRRRTRPMVCFVNVESVERIVFSIFNRFNEQWRNRALRVLHEQLDINALGHLFMGEQRRCYSSTSLIGNLVGFAQENRMGLFSRKDKRERLQWGLSIFCRSWSVRRDRIRSLGVTLTIFVLPAAISTKAHARAQNAIQGELRAPQSRTVSPAATERAASPGDTMAPNVTLDRARLFMQSGKFGEAEAVARAYLKKHLKSADGHFLLGYILFAEIHEKYVTDMKSEGTGFRYNGAVAESMANFSDAHARESLAEFTTGAKYHEPAAFDLKIVALDYVLLKDNITADKWLSLSLEWQPNDPQGWYYLGRVKYSESQFPAAVRAFKESLKVEPMNAQAEYNIGLSYAALGQKNEAIQAYQNAIAWEARSTAKDPQPYIDLATLYLDENEAEKAVPYLLQAIVFSAEVPQAHEELAKAYSLLDKLPEAQSELEKAIDLEPRKAALHCMLGQVYRKEGMLTKAKASYQRCSALQQTQSLLSRARN